jgi:hypothetical protein
MLWDEAKDQEIILKEEDSGWLQALSESNQVQRADENRRWNGRQKLDGDRCEVMPRPQQPDGQLGGVCCSVTRHS